MSRKKQITKGITTESDNKIALSCGSINPEKLSDMKAAIRALNHPLRLSILQLIDNSSGGVSVGDISDSISRIQPETSMHLKMLRKAGLVQTVRDGKKKLYQLEQARLKSLLKSIDALAEIK